MAHIKFHGSKQKYQEYWNSMNYALNSNFLTMTLQGSKVYGFTFLLSLKSLCEVWCSIELNRCTSQQLYLTFNSQLKEVHYVPSKLLSVPHYSSPFLNLNVGFYLALIDFYGSCLTKLWVRHSFFAALLFISSNSVILIIQPQDSFLVWVFIFLKPSYHPIAD